MTNYVLDDPHRIIPKGKNLPVKDFLKFGVRLFHVSLRLLELGTILSSADYQSRPHYELFRNPPRQEFLGIPRFLTDRKLELAFEEVRRSIAPEAPSRKLAIFTFICTKCAEWFRQRSRPRGFVFEVSPLPYGIIFVTDLIWRNVAANVLLKNGWRDTQFPFAVESKEEALSRVAEAYWRGHNPAQFGLDSRPEALIEGAVTIVGIIAPT